MSLSLACWNICAESGHCTDEENLE
ncbi:hypothetical protein KIPB_016032, partial [Kipferlia bialata]|eukprot:g16032.t1